MSRFISARGSCARNDRRARLKRCGVGVVGLVVVGVVAGGCGTDLAGAAATIGSQRITDSELARQVQTVTTGLAIEQSPKVSAAILGRMLTTELVAQLAAKNNVSVSQGEVDTFITAQVQQAGGQEQFEAQALKSGIAAGDIVNAVRTTLLVQKLGPVLAPGKSEEEQQIETTKAAVELARQLNVTVSPRFGVWLPEQLQIGPPPNDLSAPPPVDPGQGLVPLPQQGQDPQDPQDPQGPQGPQGQDPQPQQQAPQ